MRWRARPAGGRAAVYRLTESGQLLAEQARTRLAETARLLAGGGFGAVTPETNGS